MTRKIKLSFIITSIVLLVLVISLTSASFAIWTSTGGIGEGGTAVTPQVYAKDEYVWAKYFNYIPINDEDGDPTNNIALTTFYTNGTSPAGINLEDVIIPSTIDEKVVYQITNQVFMDSTLKELAVRVYIPASVMQIDMMAFANLPNLEEIIILGSAENNACVISDYAFVGCQNLVKITSGRKIDVTSKDAAFVSCGTLKFFNLDGVEITADKLFV